MKILKKGFVPHPAAWWIGQVIKCPQCDGAFQLEAEDPVTDFPSGFTDKGPHAEVICPTPRCTRVHWIYP